MSIRDTVAAAEDIESEIVDIPEWGVKIGVRTMDGNRRSQFMAAFQRAREQEDDDAIGHLEADLLVYCCFDPEDNSQCFVPEDIPMLLTKSGKVLGRLSKTASQLSGLAPDEEDKLLKSGSESTEQNPVATQNADSTTS